MERNDSFGSSNPGPPNTGALSGTFGSGGTQAGSQGTGLGASDTGTAGAGVGTSTGTGLSGGSDAATRHEGGESGGLTDRARDIAGSAGNRLADMGSTVRERAGSVRDTLANVLESGAERLRQQGAGGGQLAGADATGGSSGMVAEHGNRLEAGANQLAGGLQASADWLRDADLDGLKSGVERQVKEHPGRTLAIAVGLGYLLGKAFRR